MIDESQKLIVLKPFRASDKTLMNVGDDFERDSVEERQLLHYLRHGMVGPEQTSAPAAKRKPRGKSKTAPAETTDQAGPEETK